MNYVPKNFLNIQNMVFNQSVIKQYFIANVNLFLINLKMKVSEDGLTYIP